MSSSCQKINDRKLNRVASKATNKMPHTLHRIDEAKYYLNSYAFLARGDSMATQKTLTDLRISK